MPSRVVPSTAVLQQFHIHLAQSDPGSLLAIPKLMSSTVQGDSRRFCGEQVCTKSCETASYGSYGECGWSLVLMEGAWQVQVLDAWKPFALLLRCCYEADWQTVTEATITTVTQHMS